MELAGQKRSLICPAIGLVQLEQELDILDKLGLLDRSDGERWEEKLSPLDRQLDILRKLDTLSIQDKQFSEVLGEHNSGQEESTDPTISVDV